MSASYNQSFDDSIVQASPAPGIDPQQQQQQQPPQQQQQQPQMPPQPVAQLGGNDFLAPLPIPNPPSATASTSSSPPRTLWMGDLDPWSDEAAIEALWESLGKRVLVKLIKAKRGTPAANLNTGHAGYCFVEFENYDEAKSALALNGSQIPNTNRAFRLNWASGATLSSPIPQSPEFSLFVGDLSPSTTEAHLLALFQTHFKSVKTVRVMTDPVTGTSRCFGFVRFSDEEERRRALTEMSGVWCAGRPLRVALATPRSQGNGMAPPQMAPVGMQPQFGTQFAPDQFAQQQQEMPVMYPFQPGAPQMSFFQEQNGPQQVNPAAPQIAFTDPNNTTVFVGGLAASVSENMLQQLFQPFGPIQHIKIPPNKGCGFIRFESREDAVNAINAMQGFAVGGSRIRLSWGRQQNQQRGVPLAVMQGSLPLGSAGVAAPGIPQPAPPAPMSNGFGVPVPPVNYYVEQPKPFGYDFQPQIQDQQQQQQQQQQHHDPTFGVDMAAAPSDKSDSSAQEGKLQEMYRAAVAGKLDSLT